MDLEGRRALVTGGSRGIGAAVVRRLVAGGAAVALTYRSGRSAAETSAAELRASGHQVVALRADLNALESCGSLVSTAVEALGGLDILISNAGTEHFGALGTITTDDYRRVFDLNVAAQLFLTQASARVMRPGARIVLTSSVAARIAVHEHGLYGASKAAVSGLVRNLAPELAQRGITINAIAAGGTRTGMAGEHGPRYTHPLLRHLAAVPKDLLVRLQNAQERLAEPEEIAAAIAFLASTDSSYVTGSTMSVDGGQL